MIDNDEIVLEDAGAAVFSLEKAYRRAMRERDLTKMTELKPNLEEAVDQYSLGRLKLLEEGVIATDEDVAELRRIRAEIDQAASIQSLIEGAGSFVRFMAKLAV